MKKFFTAITILAAGTVLTACGHQPANEHRSTASSISKQQNYKLASSSAKLDSANLSPKQNAALVLFYAGVKNKERYVQQMGKTGQQLSIDLYSPTDAKKAGVNDKLPAGAEVIYKVSLNNGGGSTYYTLVNNQTYISNGHGGFWSKGVTTDAMVKVANQNNAGNAINQLADNASLNDLRAGANATAAGDQQGTANKAAVSSMSPQDKARAAMNADPNIDPEFKRRINLPPDDPDYIQPTHDPDSWR